jgi:hypothetical protein
MVSKQMTKYKPTAEELIKEMAEYTLTVEDAAKEMGVTTSRIRHLIIEQRLMGIMRAGAWFFKPETIHNFPRRKRGRPAKIK